MFDKTQFQKQSIYICIKRGNLLQYHRSWVLGLDQNYQDFKIQTIQTPKKNAIQTSISIG